MHPAYVWSNLVDASALACTSSPASGREQRHASLQGIESRHVRRADHRPELHQDRRLETQGPCPTARRMLLTALGSVSLLNQLSTRLGHEAPVGCGAPASTRPSSTRSGNAKSFSGHTPPAAPVAGQPQPGAVHRAAQRLLRPAGPRVRRRWPCRLTLRQPPWADPYARCCGRGGATRIPLSPICASALAGDTAAVPRLGVQLWALRPGLDGGVPGHRRLHARRARSLRRVGLGVRSPGA